LQAIGTPCSESHAANLSRTPAPRSPARALEYHQAVDDTDLAHDAVLPSQEPDFALIFELQRLRNILAESQVELERDAKRVLYSRMRELYRR
jgi:hypothetical protein